MDLKSKIKSALNEVYGNFESGLEVEYESRVTEILLNGDIRHREEWVTYNQVILELKHTLKNMLKVKQLQYELTESLSPRDTCISIIEGLESKSDELDRLYYKIMAF